MLASAFGTAAAPADDGPGGETEIRLRAKDGAYRWFLMRARVGRDADGRRTRCFGTITDIDALKRTERELRAVSGQLMRTQDDERRRIAREIHDSTLQDLVGISLTVEQIGRGALSAHEVETAIDEIRTTIARSSRDLRTLSYLLHPPLLDELGLPAAIRWFTQGFEKRSAIRITTRLPETMDRLPDEIATALFRVVQEGLANVYRHSGSRDAVVALDQTPGSIELEIIDYGSGLGCPAAARDATPPVALGVGIPGMRLRLQQIGGTLDISTGTGGTTLRASVPFAAGRDREAAGAA
jgi:signal transduction histidine kinase